MSGTTRWAAPALGVLCRVDFWSICNSLKMLGVATTTGTHQSKHRHLPRTLTDCATVAHAAGEPARTGRVSTTRAVPSTVTAAVIVHVQVMRNGGMGSCAQ